MPRQSNGYDCGVFMLTCMSLVCNGLCLSKEAYTLHTRHSHATTDKETPGVTYMGNGVNSKATRWSPQETTAATPDEGSPAGRAPGLRGHLRKKKQRAEGRLTLGNTALRQRWWGSETGQSSRREERCSKRSAKTEAEEEGSDRKRVRIFQPPMKRARNLIAGH